VSEIDDILDELTSYFERPPRLAGDIDRDMLAEKFGCSINTAINKMHQLEKTGKYKLVKVFDRNWKKVLRKV